MMGPALFDLYSPSYGSTRRKSSLKNEDTSSGATPLLKTKSTSTPTPSSSTSSSLHPKGLLSGLSLQESSSRSRSKSGSSSNESLNIKDSNGKQYLSRSKSAATSSSSSTAAAATGLPRYGSFKVKYIGCSVLDRRHTYAMLPWVIADIKRRSSPQSSSTSSSSLSSSPKAKLNSYKAREVYLEITEIGLRVVSADPATSSEPLFLHSLQNIQKFAQTAQDGKYFTYLIRDELDTPFTCHVFQAMDEGIVLDIINSVREATKEAVPKVGNQLLRVGSTSGLDNILANSQQYEVMYVGRIRMSQKRAPPSFIDESVEKFKELEANRRINEVDSEDSKDSKPTPPTITTTEISGSVSGGSDESNSTINTSTRRLQSLSSPSLDSTMYTYSMHRPRSISSLTTCTEDEEGTGSDLQPEKPSSSIGGGDSRESSLVKDLREYSRERSMSPQLSSSPHTLHLPSASLIPSTQSLDEEGRASIMKDLQEVNKSSSKEIGDPLGVGGHYSSGHSKSGFIVNDGQSHQSPSGSSSRTRSISGDVPRCGGPPQKQLSLPYYRTRTNSGGKDLRKMDTNRPSNRLQNKTMLFLIGRLELCLISPDRHQVLLNKTFNYVSHCSQGVQHTDHFGFICRETSFNTAETYVGYVFRCSTEKLVEEIMHALKQAFHNAHHAYQSTKNKAALICSKCPMDWFHHLCCDIEALPPERAQSVIFRRIESMPDFEQKELMSTYQENHGSFVESIQDQNEILMNLLRKMCERKQSTHQHQPQVVTSGSGREMMTSVLDKRGQTVTTLGTLKQKARKSLSSSFETILKRRSNSICVPPTFRGRSATIDMSSTNYFARLAHGDSDLTTPESLSPVSRTEFSFNEDLNSGRPRSATIGGSRDVQRDSSPLSSSMMTSTQRAGSIQLNRHQQQQQSSPKSPLFNIFMKIGNQKTSSIGSESGHWSSDTSSSPPPQPSSWRRNIFSSLQSNSQQLTHMKKNVKFSDTTTDDIGQVALVEPPKRRTREELRALWTEAIKQQILLIQMEKENKRLQANQSQVCYKRMKLDYEEVSVPDEKASKAWERILCHRQTIIERSEIVAAVRNGVPKNKRGEVWIFLAEQQKLGNFLCRKDCSQDGINLETPYRQLLQQLTVQQHAILVDLGRTFPKHPFYAQPLGPGQLSLFNLLKAYSLFDKEVGYCQGLSFVAGILLLHMNEDEAFEMMKHLLFYQGLRKQYKPDMSALQMQLYQLTRLLYDIHHDLYQHFECHDISPTLYAAPWFLTLFASQFSIGFVARLFDLIFLNGLEAVFRISLTLLGHFKSDLLRCTSFESIMDFIKVRLPSLDSIETEAIFSSMYELDFVSKKVELYEIEYGVLQEEMIFSSGGQSGGRGSGGRGQPVLKTTRSASLGGSLESPPPRTSTPLSVQPVITSGDLTGVTTDSPTNPKVDLSVVGSPTRKEVSTETYSEINERLRELEEENRTLRRSNMEAVDQLHVSQSTVHSLESQLDNYKSTIKRLETRVRSMEDERDALLQSLNIVRRRLERLESAAAAVSGDNQSSSSPSNQLNFAEDKPILNIIGVGGESNKQQSINNTNVDNDEGGSGQQQGGRGGRSEEDEEDEEDYDEEDEEDEDEEDEDDESDEKRMQKTSSCESESSKKVDDN